MDWLALVSTAAGAAIAFAGTVVADVLRRRDNRHRWDYGERRRAYSEMILALGKGLDGLRRMAGTDLQGGQREAASRAAVGGAGVYEAREKLLLAADGAVIRSAEAAFAALIALRDAVASGADLGSGAYHDAYHPFAQARWDLRTAVRVDLGAGPLHARDIGRDSWDGRDSCQTCRARDTAAAGAPVPAPAAPAR